MADRGNAQGPQERLQSRTAATGECSTIETDTHHGFDRGLAGNAAGPNGQRTSARIGGPMVVGLRMESVVGIYESESAAAPTGTRTTPSGAVDRTTGRVYRTQIRWGTRAYCALARTSTPKRFGANLGNAKKCG